MSKIEAKSRTSSRFRCVPRRTHSSVTVGGMSWRHRDDRRRMLADLGIARSDRIADVGQPVPHLHDDDLVRRRSGEHDIDRPRPRPRADRSPLRSPAAIRRASPSRSRAAAASDARDPAAGPLPAPSPGTPRTAGPRRPRRSPTVPARSIRRVRAPVRTRSAARSRRGGRPRPGSFVPNDEPPDRRREPMLDLRACARASATSRLARPDRAATVGPGRGSPAGGSAGIVSGACAVPG